MTDEPKAKLKMARKAFQNEVENIASEDGSYLEAIQRVCENNDIEVEAASFYVTGALKEQATLEAKRKFLLRKELCQEEIVELPLE